VNRLLGLDTQREVAFSMVSLGHVAGETPAASRELPELSFPTVPLSKSEVEYPELWKIHQASSLQTPEEVAAWRARAKSSADKSVPSDAVAGFSARSTDTIEQVILRRGSSRRFAPKPITLEHLRTILEVSTGPVWPGFTLFNDLYLIVNA